VFGVVLGRALVLGACRTCQRAGAFDSPLRRAAAEHELRRSDAGDSRVRRSDPLPTPRSAARSAPAAPSTITSRISTQRFVRVSTSSSNRSTSSYEGVSPTSLEPQPGRPRRPSGFDAIPARRGTSVVRRAAASRAHRRLPWLGDATRARRRRRDRRRREPAGSGAPPRLVPLLRRALTERAMAADDGVAHSRACEAGGRRASQDGHEPLRSAKRPCTDMPLRRPDVCRHA